MHYPLLCMMRECRDIRTDWDDQKRAFADFVLGSLILHFFCVNFIN